jgi:drug/metabolite transporter (DMT)-like permease
VRLRLGSFWSCLSGRVQTNLGAIYFLAAIGLIFLIDTICNFYTNELHAAMLVWGYFVGITFFGAGYFGSRGQFALLQSRQPALQIARSGFLVLSISGLFVSLTYLPIAEATAIGFIGPLFITILSVPFLGERVGRHRWLAVMIGLAGVLVIARPGGAVWHWSAIMKARLAIVRRELQSIAGYVVRPPVGLGSE